MAGKRGGKGGKGGGGKGGRGVGRTVEEGREVDTSHSRTIQHGARVGRFNLSCHNGKNHIIYHRSPFW